MTFILFSLQIKEVFVSISGSDNNICNYSSPCSFRKALEIFPNDTTLFLVDSTYKSSADLFKFQIFAQKALSMGFILNGNKIILDGTFLPQVFPAFLTIRQCNVVDIENFTYINFHTPIICTNLVNNSLITYSNVINCSSNNHIGLFIAGGSHITFYKVNFTFNILNHSSLISSHNSKLFIYESFFQNNIINDNGIEPVICTINSVTETANSTFINNSLPEHSLFSYEYFSYAGYWNVSFYDNIWGEMTFCDGPAEINMTNATITSNNGPIFDSKGNSMLSFENVSIIRNTCFCDPLFIMRNSTLIFSFNVTMISNQAPIEVFSSGKNSKTSIIGLKLISSLSESFLNVEGKAKVRINNSYFKALIPLISISNGSLLFVQNCSFMTNFTLNIIKSTCYIYNSTFVFPKFKKIAPIINQNGSINIKNSTFSLSSQISSSETLQETPILKCINSQSCTLSDLVFSVPLQFALEARQIKNCMNCHVQRNSILFYHKLSSTIVIPGILFPVMLLIIFYIFIKKRYFFAYIRKCLHAIRK